MFVDASLSAMACVAFFRVIDCGQARCSLVASKAKVVPLKPLSIFATGTPSGRIGKPSNEAYRQQLFS